MLAPGSMITALPGAPITIADRCRRAFALGNQDGPRTKTISDRPSVFAAGAPWRFRGTLIVSSAAARLMKLEAK